MRSDDEGRQEWVRRLELLAAVALLIVLLLMLFEWNMLRGPIERRVSAATGVKNLQNEAPKWATLLPQLPHQALDENRLTQLEAGLILMLRQQPVRNRRIGRLRKRFPASGWQTTSPFPRTDPY